jgi:protein BCP1
MFIVYDFATPCPRLILMPMQEKAVIKTLTEYLVTKSTSHSTLSQVSNLLSPTSDAQIGLILTERLINMPPETTPPMYTMLLEEIEWALAEKEPYEFTHYLVLSKTYKEVQSMVDAEESRPAKKQKGKDKDATVYYFHAEAEVLHKYALGFGDFEYTVKADEGAADAKRTFLDAGIEPMGHMVLIEAAKFAEAVEAVRKYLNP